MSLRGSRKLKKVKFCRGCAPQKQHTLYDREEVTHPFRLFFSLLSIDSLDSSSPRGGRSKVLCHERYSGSGSLQNHSLNCWIASTQSGNRLSETLRTRKDFLASPTLPKGGTHIFTTADMIQPETPKRQVSAPKCEAFRPLEPNGFEIIDTASPMAISAEFPMFS